MKKLFCVLCVFSSIAFADEAKKDLNWSGDFRYRHEYVSQENPTSGPSAYHQERIRARLGVSPAINETTVTEFRLTTAPGRTGTNQTLGASSSAFSNYSITLDRAGFKTKPTEFFSLQGGRLGNPYFEAVESDLIFDTDLNFDGLSIALKHSSEPCHLFLNSSFYWVDKSTTVGTQDVTMQSGQFGYRHTFNENTNIVGAVAVHHFAHIQGHQTFATAATPSGNSTVTASSKSYYATGFNLINPGLEFKTQVAGQAITLMFDYVTNSNATSEKTGYLLGFKVGKTKKTHDWMFGYDYRLLKKDATVSAFSDADAWGGGTNGKGHRIILNYQIAENMTAGLSTYLGQAGPLASEEPVRRNKVHADLVFKF